MSVCCEFMCVYVSRSVSYAACVCLHVVHICVHRLDQYISRKRDNLKKVMSNRLNYKRPCV